MHLITFHSKCRAWQLFCLLNWIHSLAVTRMRCSTNILRECHLAITIAWVTLQPSRKRKLSSCFRPDLTHIVLHISHPKRNARTINKGKNPQWLHARCLNFFLALAGNFDWQGFDCLCMRTHTPMPSNAAVRQPAWNNVHGDLKVVWSFWFLLSQWWFMGEIIKWRYNKSHNVNVSAACSWGGKLS